MNKTKKKNSNQELRKKIEVILFENSVYGCTHYFGDGSKPRRKLANKLVRVLLPRKKKRKTAR